MTVKWRVENKGNYKGGRMKIINVVCSNSFSTPISFDEIIKKIQSKNIVFTVRQLNKINVIQFRYKNTLVRIFPSGNYIILISKPFSFKECEDLVNEIHLFLNDLLFSE